MSPSGALQVLAALALPALAGAGVLAVIARGGSESRLERLGWAYPLGAFLTAAVVGLFILSGVHPARWATILLPAALGGLLLVRGSGRRTVVRESHPGSAPSSGRLERAAFWLALTLVGVLMVDRIAVFDLTPLIRGDEGIIWAMRAKVLHHGWLDRPASPGFESGLTLPGHSDYPLMNPLLQVWTFEVAGGITDVLNRVPMQAVFLAMLLTCAARLRMTLRPAAAALFLLLWLPSRWLESAWFSADSDVLVACGFVLALEAWRDFCGQAGRPAWRRFACALAFLAWSKHEGAMLVSCVLAGATAAAVCSQAARKAVLSLRWALSWLLLPAGVLAATWAVNAAGGHENDLISTGAGRPSLFGNLFSVLPERAGPITRYVVEEIILRPDVSRLLWIPFLATLVLKPGFAFAPGQLAATVAILGGAIGYWLVFAGTVRPFEWHLETAAARVFGQLWPALFLWTARAAAGFFPPIAQRA